MKRTLFAAVIGMSVLTSCSTTPYEPVVPDYVDSAEVIQAEPLYRTVQIARPVNECWTERAVRGERRQGGYAAPVVGGMLGGVLANRLYRGRNRTPVTVAGALVGAAIGEGVRTASRRPPSMTSVRRCRTVKRYEPRQQLIGYRVDYRYEGQTFTTRTRSNPGRFIRVRVDVDPVDGT